MTAISAGVATFTYKDNNTICEEITVSSLNVYDKPVPTSVGDDMICIGFSTYLQLSTGGSWISSNVSVATVTDDGQVTGKSQGIVRFTFIFDEGCSSNQTAPVIVYGPPSISIDGDNQLCAGGSLLMLPSTEGTWASNNESVATINNGGLVTAVTVGTLRFTYTESAAGCKSAEAELITVNDIPETSVNGPDSICIGGVTNLTPTTGGI